MKFCIGVTKKLRHEKFKLNVHKLIKLNIKEKLNSFTNSFTQFIYSIHEKNQGKTQFIYFRY